GGAGDGRWLARSALAVVRSRGASTRASRGAEIAGTSIDSAATMGAASSFNAAPGTGSRAPSVLTATDTPATNTTPAAILTHVRDANDRRTGARFPPAGITSPGTWSSARRIRLDAATS